MYHVAGTIIVTLLLYLVSFLFCRTRIYSQTLHRKIWNTVLAATFLYTALAGILMALQQHIQLETGFTGFLRKWHVEAGVILGITGILHFLRHLPYFGSLFRRDEDEQPGNENIPAITAHPGVNLFMIGFTSTSVQILLMREIMNIAGGYELSGGIFLGSWLILSSAGAAIAGRSGLNNLSRINMLFAAGPVASSVFFLLLARLFLDAGEIPSILETLVFTLILLTPVCLLSGFTFVKLMVAARDSDGSVPGKSFSVETTGGIVAGIVTTILTSGILNTWELLITTIILYIAYYVLTYRIKGKLPALTAKLFFLLLISLVLIADTDKLFRQILLPAVKITETRDTPYGNITRASYSGEESIYYNQRLLTYANDAMECEENVHYAMLQREKHERVLLISGSLNSHLREISKYNVSEVVYVESDPGLADFAETADSTMSARLKSVYRDAYSFINRSEGSYDAVIMLLPPPSTLSLNRYYTYEFFRKLKSRISNEGVFIFSPGPNDNYFNDESVNLYSSVFNSLSAVFMHVEPVAGNKLYLIASDRPLSVAFGSLAESRGIVNHYVNSSFLSDDLVRSKSDEIKALFRKEVKKNTSAFPVASLHFQEYNFSRDLNEKLPAVILIIAAFVIPVIAVRKSNLMMYFCASALAGFEIIALLMIQMTAGNMYHLTGLTIAVVMTGLAAGAGTGGFLQGRKGLNLKVLMLACFYLAIAMFFSFVLKGNSTFIQVPAILITAAVPSFITGNIFRELTSGHGHYYTAGAIYSADLAGSALGFIILSGVAIPALGIRNSIILISLLIFAGIIFGTKGK